MVLKDGRTLNHFTPHAYGTKQNPMESESVNAKVRDLLEPVLGPSRTEAVIERVNGLEGVASVQELLPFLTLEAAGDGRCLCYSLVELFLNLA